MIVVVMIVVVMIVVLTLPLCLPLLTERLEVVVDQTFWKLDLVSLQQTVHDLASHLLARHELPPLGHLLTDVILQLIEILKLFAHVLGKFIIELGQSPFSHLSCCNEKMLLLACKLLIRQVVPIGEIDRALFTRLHADQ